jgi:hypothetical protein
MIRKPGAAFRNDVVQDLDPVHEAGTWMAEASRCVDDDYARPRGHRTIPMIAPIVEDAGFLAGTIHGAPARHENRRNKRADSHQTVILALSATSVLEGRPG